MVTRTLAFVDIVRDGEGFHTQRMTKYGWWTFAPPSKVSRVIPWLNSTWKP